MIFQKFFQDRISQLEFKDYNDFCVQVARFKDDLNSLNLLYKNFCIWCQITRELIDKEKENLTSYSELQDKINKIKSDAELFYLEHKTVLLYKLLQEANTQYSDAWMSLEFLKKQKQN